MSTGRARPDRADRRERTGRGRTTGPRRVIDGRACLPGCVVDAAPVGHFCCAPVGSVPEVPRPFREGRRFRVEVARDGEERTIALGDQAVIAPEAIPRLVCLLLDAYRMTR